MRETSLALEMREMRTHHRMTITRAESREDPRDAAAFVGWARRELQLAANYVRWPCDHAVLLSASRTSTHEFLKVSLQTRQQLAHPRLTFPLAALAEQKPEAGPKEGNCRRSRVRVALMRLVWAGSKLFRRDFTRGHRQERIKASRGTRRFIIARQTGCRIAIKGELQLKSVAGREKISEEEIRRKRNVIAREWARILNVRIERKIE